MHRHSEGGHLIERLRSLARRFWPVMRLRWVFFGTLFFVAALPGLAALGLRVYENALVRRTEAELAAQAAAIAATTALLWPVADATAGPSPSPAGRRLQLPPQSKIDLRNSPILPPRPAAKPVAQIADPIALDVAEDIAPVIAETKRTTLASILLLDRNGILVTGPEAGRSLAALQEIKAALAGREVTVLRRNDSYVVQAPISWVSQGTTIRLHHARPITVAGQTVGVVLVSRSPAALFRGMWEDAGKIAVGVLLIALLLVLLTGVLVRAIVRPIEKLSAASKALASGRSANPGRPTLEVREIRNLYDNFSTMSDSIAHRSRYLRDFAASLSHEFKTPLAGLRGGIELLQDHGAGMSEAERKTFLSNIAGDTERLSRLVSRMMELAKADMREGELAEPADLASIAARVADSYSSTALEINPSIPPKLPKLAIEANALESILATLVENAKQAGARIVGISASQQVDDCLVEIHDDGPGIPQGDIKRIFDPFFTSRREEGGTGLGLAIARSLVRNSGGSLDIGHSEHGARFLLVIPFQQTT